MFNELVESATAPRPTGKRWTVAASAIVQSACLLALILIPLIYTAALPPALLHTILMEPVPAPVQPRTPPPAPNSGRRIPSLLARKGFFQPVSIPPQVAIYAEPEAPLALFNDLGTDGLLSAPTLLDGLKKETVVERPPSPAPTAARVQRGGDVEAARIISQAQPAYPALARQAGIQGTVLLHAIIDRYGRVIELEVISGHPLLVKAALEAVKQWRYQPTLLNNEPVEVDTTIRVNFVLNR